MAPDRRRAGLAVFLLAVAALIVASLLTSGPATRPGRVRAGRPGAGRHHDRLSQPSPRVVRQVTDGSADMPAHRGVIRRRVIRDVAAYVAWATRKAPPAR